MGSISKTADGNAFCGLRILECLVKTFQFFALRNSPLGPVILADENKARVLGKRFLVGIHAVHVGRNSGLLRLLQEQQNIRDGLEQPVLVCLEAGIVPRVAVLTVRCHLLYNVFTGNGNLREWRKGVESCQTSEYKSLKTDFTHQLDRRQNALQITGEASRCQQPKPPSIGVSKNKPAGLRVSGK